MQRTARRFQIAAALVACLLLAAIGLLVWQLHSAQQAERARLIEQAGQRATQLAHAIEGRIAALVRSVDFVLLGARRAYRADQAELHAFAELLRESFPGEALLLVQLSVAGPDGVLTYSSLGLSGRVEIGDREHFRAHLDGSDRLYISRPVVGRVSGVASIQFSRPILRAGGFAGVAVISISPEHLGKLLASFQTVPGDEIGLLDSEGVVLSLSQGSALAKLGGRKLPEPLPFAQAGAPAHGLYRGSSFADGVERVHAWHRVGETGLVALVGLDSGRALAPLEQHVRRAWATVLFLAGALLLLGAGVIELLLRMSRQQQAVERSEMRFRSLTQLSSDWYWEQDQRFRFTQMAGRLLERTGIPPETHLGKTRWDMPALNLGEADWARHRADLEAHRPFHDFEMRRPDTDGGPHWVSISGEPVFDRQGRFTGYRGVGRDITERKHAEQALRDLTERLRIGQATARMIVMDWDIANDRIVWSDSPEWLRGPLPADTGRYPLFKDQVHPEDRERFLAIRAQSIESLRGQVLEYRVVRTDGEVLWLRSHQKVIAGADGRAERMLIALLDITERMRMEQRTRGQARLLDLIFRHSLDNIVLLDRDFNFMRVSESYARAGQRDIAEFVGRNHFELYPSNFREEVEQVRAGKTIYQRTERPFVYPDHPEWGVTHWDLGLVPILGADGEVELFLFTLKDVSERVRAAAALRESAARLRRLSHRLRGVEERERRAMARELHDRIGQSLSTLNLSLGMLGQQLSAGKLEDAGEQLLDLRQVLKATIGHVRDLMCELRPPALEEFGLLAALKDLAADFTRKTRLPAQLDGEPLDPRPSVATEMAMYRIAQEALNNVARHARATRVHLHLSPNAEAIELAITDDGVGFDINHPRNGDPTWGLATMRERAEDAGIEFAIDSGPGRGTRVTLRVARET